MPYPQLDATGRARFREVLRTYSQRPPSTRRKHPLRAIAEHAANKRGRLQTPLVAMLDLTNHCNQNCVFCYREGPRGLVGSDRRWTDVPLDRLRGLLETLRSMGVPSVSLSGGEASCHPQFVEALTTAKRMGFATTLVTNGTNFERSHVELLADLLEPACDKIELSLDAATATTYRKVRNSGKFDRVLATLGMFAEMRIPFTTMSLVLRDNAHEIRPAIRLALDHGATSCGVEPPFPKQHMATDSFAPPDLVLDVYEACLADPGLQDRAIVLNFLHFSQMAGCTADVDAVLGAEQDPLSGCHAGHATCTIDVWGGLHLCSYLINAKTSHVGNVYETPIPELWRAARRARGCVSGSCSGGCPAFDLDLATVPKLRERTGVTVS